MGLRDVCLALIAVMLWGGNFVAAKFSLAHYSPFLLTAMRFAVVAIILVPLVKRPDAANMKRIALLALALGVLHFSLLFGSLYQGLSIMACILVSQLGTPFACILGWLIYGDRMSLKNVIALALAFAGVALIAATPHVTAHLLGFILALSAGVAWACANVVLKSITEKNIYTILGWMGIFAVPQLLLLSFLFEGDQWHQLATPDVAAMAGLAYTIVFSTFIAYGIWYYLVRKYMITQVVPFALLTPVTGIFISRLYFADAFTPQMVAGGALTLVSVALITLRRPKVVLPPE